MTDHEKDREAVEHVDDIETYHYCLECREGVLGIVGQGPNLRHRVTIIPADSLGIDEDTEATEGTCGPVVLRRGPWIRPEDRLDEIERLRDLLDAAKEEIEEGA